MAGQRPGQFALARLSDGLPVTRMCEAAIDLSAYRASSAEQARIRDLFKLIPEHGERALDVGARDGYMAKLLADRYQEVVALDLEQPKIDHPRVRAVKGDAARLGFPDRFFDVVLCAEVLEHIPPDTLPEVCRQICRVSRGIVVIGVPYRQDLRCGRTTCSSCGWKNPPWGHVNSFDESRLRSLFPQARVDSIGFVGTTRAQTNSMSTALLDFAGNPYGTWDQEEACVRCGASIGKPRERNLLQKVATRLAMKINDVQSSFTRPRANWIHVVFAVS